VFHAGVVMAQIGNALTSRTEKGRVHHLGWFSNRFLLAGLAVQVALFMLLVYVEPLASLFEHLPIPPAYWLGLSLFAPALYALGWVGKSLARRADRKSALVPRSGTEGQGANMGRVTL
jgi:hypothetical protein